METKIAQKFCDNPGSVKKGAPSEKATKKMKKEKMSRQRERNL
ncbi:unnamed protein product [Camellia sinensis]